MRLHSVSEVVLSRVLSWVAETEATAAHFDRPPSEVVVLYESKTVLFGPNAGLYDLLLGAHLLRYRASSKEYMERDRIPLKTSRRWVAESRQRIDKGFAQILSSIDGYFHPRCGSRRPPYLAWNKLPHKATEAAWGAAVASQKAEIRTLPAVSVTGDDDLSWLEQEVRLGRIEPKQDPRFPELPFLVVPLKGISCVNGLPVSMEWFEEELKGAERYIRGFAQCFRRKSEGILSAHPEIRLRSTAGRFLDHTRLASVPAARAAGQRPRIFTPHLVVERMPAFLPDQHTVILAVDMNQTAGLHSSVSDFSCIGR